MKTLILHGDNVEESRRRLQKFIDVAHKRKWDVVKVSGKSDNLADAISSKSLFGGERLIVVDDAQHLSKDAFLWFKNNESKYEDTICFFAIKLLTKTQLNTFKNAKVESFETPKLVWSFLDSIYPGNTKKCIQMFHDVIATEPVEMVFALLARHMKDLYHVTVDSQTFKGPDWRKSKLKKQANQFGEEALRDAISQLAEIDIKTKSSNATLRDELQFFFITSLNH